VERDCCQRPSPRRLESTAFAAVLMPTSTSDDGPSQAAASWRDTAGSRGIDRGDIGRM
jgi:hypothetical protein